MNGTRMFRPADRVSLYFPNRSTTPARACGMIFTVLASMPTTNSSSSTARIINAIATTISFSVAELGKRMDVRRRAADLEDLHGRADLDGLVLVVRRGGPDLAPQLDLPDGEAGHPLGDDSPLAEQLAGAEDEVGALVEARDQRRPDQPEHRDRRGAGEEHLDRYPGAQRGAHRTGERADGQHR